MIEKLVDEHEINIESFKASATRNEFEEMVIFWMYCMTMTGWCNGKYYRDFIIDTMKLTMGYILIGISSKETAKTFDEKFNNRWFEYKSIYDKYVVESTEKNWGIF